MRSSKSRDGAKVAGKLEVLSDGVRINLCECAIPIHRIKMNPTEVALLLNVASG
jgi:hypothetical protein